MELHKSKSTIYVVVFVIGIIFVGFNLRPAITSIGPLIGIIQDDLNLPHWSMGLLTSLPLIAFALCSPIVPRFARRFTNTWAMIMGLVLIFLGIFVRVIPSVLWLYTGTIIVGIGIAICNVLLPVVVKENFPEKVGLMTSVYSTSIGIFASLASGVSVPLAVDLQLGWNQALLVWLAPVVIAIIIWFYISKFNKSKQTGTENSD